MKSAAQILKELGFNPDSSPEVQKAFLKHLVQQAGPNHAKNEEKPRTKSKQEPAQLEFNFDDKKRVS
jgi:hypothetical protein